MYSVQQSFPKWAKVLPPVKHIQKAQYALNRHLNVMIPIKVEHGRKTAQFEYRQFTDYLLSKYGLLDIIQDQRTTEPVIIAITFDGGGLSASFSATLPVDTS